ncbi:MAG TPA: hypothetical protein DCP36_19805 [Sporomusaceae bacterium]|nr:hypothetical protein [Sporomusaceae bacterium]
MDIKTHKECIGLKQVKGYVNVRVASAGRTVGDVPFLSLTGVARLLHGLKLARSCQDALKEIAKIWRKRRLTIWWNADIKVAMKRLDYKGYLYLVIIPRSVN